MRKGLWSPDEDEKLRTCIALHTSGSWSDIARKAGLQRCGKSCRRRWMNHLRPDLKREKFTIEEVKLVAKLHQTLGNKWSEIATFLVGRTDNDVKNLWNTQIKKQLKNGHYNLSYKNTSKNFNGYLFGMDSTFEQIEPLYIDMCQQTRDNTKANGTHLIANSSSTFGTHGLELNLQHNLQDINEAHNVVNKNFSPFFASKAYPHAHAESISQYVRMGEDTFCSLLNEDNIIDNADDYVTKANECNLQLSPNDANHNIHPHLHMETVTKQHYMDSNLSISRASWEGPGSSNDSSIGTINVGDETSSVCKPPLYEFSHQAQSQEALGNCDHNQYLKDYENDVSSLSRKESWSSTLCEQWALESLIGYCEAYTKTTWS
ncbi:hypothetical protein L7F22_036172 [Adiantum nelumboides]|nr:hypothetical protein [Adiantum nelumboides]